MIAEQITALEHLIKLQRCSHGPMGRRGKTAPRWTGRWPVATTPESRRAV